MGNIIPYLEVGSNYDLVASARLPGIIKTYLNHSFFERALKSKDGPKFIVIAQNLKDTLVSYFYHHHLLPYNFDGIPRDEFF